MTPPAPQAQLPQPSRTTATPSPTRRGPIRGVASGTGAAAGADRASRAHHFVRTANAPSTGSQTITTESGGSRQAVLRLRGASFGGEIQTTVEGEGGATGRRIQWAEGVVDNEGLGRKSSKVCCIYHAPRNIDSSSDESSSCSSSSDSDSGDDGGARPAAGYKKGKSRGRGHHHEHGEDCSHGSGGAGKGDKGKGRAPRKRSPNAYEKMPTVKKPSA